MSAEDAPDAVPPNAFAHDVPEALDDPERPPADGESLRDVFAHWDYARVIATTVTDAPAPFTLGLFGRRSILKSVARARADANKLRGFAPVDKPVSAP